MIHGIVVLVCGGRDFNDRELVTQTLNRIHRERKIRLLIHGGAGGADQLASDWAAVTIYVPRKAYPANWLKHGRAAGPIRNQQMLDESKPDLVVAFPGGRGTADMVRRAKSHGVEVMEVVDER